METAHPVTQNPPLVWVAIITTGALAAASVSALGWRALLLVTAIFMAAWALRQPIVAMFIGFVLFPLNGLNFPLMGGVRVFHAILLMAYGTLLIHFLLRRRGIPLKRLIPVDVLPLLGVLVVSALFAPDQVEAGRIVSVAVLFVLALGSIRLWGYLERHSEPFFLSLERVHIAAGIVMATAGYVVLLAQIRGFEHDLFPLILSGFLPRLHFTEDPNHFATYLLPALVLSFPAGRSGAVSWRRKLAFAYVLLAYILTISAGGLLTLALMCGLMQLRFRFISLKRVITVATLIIGAAGVIALSGQGQVQQGIWDLVINQKSESSTERRITWDYAIRMGLENPVIGVGPDNAKFHVPRAIHYGKPQDIHNGFLQLFAETGFPGLVLFLAFGALCIRNTWRLATNRRLDPNLRDRAYRFLTLLICAVFAHVFLSMINTPSVWFAFALCYVLLDGVRSRINMANAGK